MRIVYFKEWREYRGLKQIRAAELLGMTRGYLCKLETPKPALMRRYNEDFLGLCSDVYACETWELFFHPEDKRRKFLNLCATIPRAKIPGADKAVRDYLRKSKGIVFSVTGPKRSRDKTLSHDR